jgi:hypothetical protein
MARARTVAQAAQVVRSEEPRSVAEVVKEGEIAPDHGR